LSDLNRQFGVLPQITSAAERIKERVAVRCGVNKSFALCDAIK
jgi:hypothetical protein